MAGHRIVGIKTAKEIALTRKGANPYATKVVLKSFDSPQSRDPQSETPPAQDDAMNPATIKAILGLSEVAKAYALALPDEKLEPFLALAPEAREAEATKAKAEADAAEIAKRAAAEGKSAREVELEKKLGEQGETIADLTKRLDERDAEAEIIKTAESAEYRGYPGGADVLVPLLKSAAKLPDAEGDEIRKSLQAQAALSRTTTQVRGLHVVEGDFAKRFPARAELDQKVEEIFKSKGGDRMAIRGEILRDPNNAELFERVQREQQADAA